MKSFLNEKYFLLKKILDHKNFFLIFCEFFISKKSLSILLLTSVEKLYILKF